MTKVRTPPSPDYVIMLSFDRPSTLMMYRMITKIVEDAIKIRKKEGRLGFFFHFFICMDPPLLKIFTSVFSLWFRIIFLIRNNNWLNIILSLESMCMKFFQKPCFKGEGWGEPLFFVNLITKMCQNVLILWRIPAWRTPPGPAWAEPCWACEDQEKRYWPGCHTWSW